MAQPVLYGATYSVYVRAVRLALEEKAIRYCLVEIDVFAPAGLPVQYFQRQPFGKIPALEHDGTRLYETGAITRYIDEAFEGPALQPEGAVARARMNQVISILDNYIYPDMIRGHYVEMVEGPRHGNVPTEQRVSELVARSERCLAALDVLVPGVWIAGETMTLADLHAAPMFDLLKAAPAWDALLSRYPRVASWWREIEMRPSMSATVGSRR